MGKPDTITIRPASEADIDSIAQIDALCHSQWTRDQFRDEMNVSFSITLVAETGGKITGFIVLRFISPEAEILNIAVHPDARRNGLGRSLLEGAISSPGARDGLKVFLEVREKNTTARAFYTSLGFREISVRKNYYSDDNAIILEATFDEDK